MNADDDGRQGARRHLHGGSRCVTTFVTKLGRKGKDGKKIESMEHFKLMRLQSIWGSRSARGKHDEGDVAAAMREGILPVHAASTSRSMAKLSGCSVF